MLAERVGKLTSEYVDQYVAIDGERPELARFADMVGQVRAINHNGRALVEFDANGNRGRYDIGLDYLKVVDKPEPTPAKAKPAAKKAAAAPKPKTPEDKAAATAPEESKPDAKLSPLEVARMKKEEPGDAGKSPQPEKTPAKATNDEK